MMYIVFSRAGPFHRTMSNPFRGLVTDKSLQVNTSRHVATTPLGSHCRQTMLCIPLSPHHSMLTPKTVWSLANFCPRGAPKAGASSKGNIDFRGSGGVNLKHALPRIRYIFTCKLLSVTCPKWTCECVHWHLAICMSPLQW